MERSAIKPSIALVDDAVRENARRWRAHAGAPVWAVVKADGYTWGALRLVAILDDVVEGYFVADASEAREIRSVTSRPIATFAASQPAEVAELLDAGIIPNVASQEALRAADRWARARGLRARIRVGIVPAAGWSGLLEDAIAPFVAACSGAAVEIELWSHLTAPSLWGSQRERFDRARRAFETAGVPITGTDHAGTFVSAVEGRTAQSRVRIGIGLFGARDPDGSGPELACALRIEAPVVDVLPASAVRSAGYRPAEPLPEPWLAVVRCGYADGLPTRLAGTNNIVSVGMQYAVVARKSPEQIGDGLRLLDTSSDLCTFLTGTGMSPHEFVVGVGRGVAEHARHIEKR